MGTRAPLQSAGELMVAAVVVEAGDGLICHPCNQARRRRVTESNPCGTGSWCLKRGVVRWWSKCDGVCNCVMGWDRMG